MSRPGYIKLPNDVGGSKQAVDLHEDSFLAGIGLHVLCLGYCDRQRTDGFIPRRAMRVIAPGIDCEPLVAELERVGFLEPAPDGWTVPGYLDWQRSREQIEGASESARRAARSRWGNADGSAPSNADCSAEGSAESNAPNQPTIGTTQTTTEDPSSAAEAADEVVAESPGSQPGTAVAVNDGFSDFWDAYPRHEARKASRAAWRRLTRQERLLATGVARVMGELVHRGHKERRYVPMAPSFLNGRRFMDWEEGVPAGWEAPERDQAAQQAANLAAAVAAAQGGEEP